VAKSGPESDFSDGDAPVRRQWAVDRRTFLKAGLLAAGAAKLGGCIKPQPLERIVPYVEAPEHVIPGVPAFYASVLPTDGFGSGYGRGVVVESHEGRPTKIEGNGLHPSSLGGTDIFMQAAAWQVYDPDRSKRALYKNEPIGWGGAFGKIRDFIAMRGGPKRVRIALLMGTVTSPSVVGQLEQMAKVFPNLRRFVDEPLGGSNTREGTARALGQRVTPVYDLRKAVRIVSLDAHFLGEGPGKLRYDRDYAARRRLDREKGERLDAEGMARLYVAESSYTYTGAMADHRIALRPSMVPAVAARLLARVSGDGRGQEAKGDLPGEMTAWVNAVAEDLLAHRSKAVMMAGEYQPAAVHAATHAINRWLRASGNTVAYLEPIENLPEKEFGLGDLVKAVENGEVDLLIMMDVNPAYGALGDVGFGEMLKEMGYRDDRLAVAVGGYADETADLCGVHLPLSHALEAWGDLRGHDGTVGIVQPLIEPLWGTRSMVEILASLMTIADENNKGGGPAVLGSGYDMVRGEWLDRWKDVPEGDRQMRWRRCLRDGIVPDTRAAEAKGLKDPDAAGILKELEEMQAANKEAVEVVFRPDPSIGDGAWANVPWLQECPKPLTKVTWGNVAMMGMETAKRMGIVRATDPSRRGTAEVRIAVGGTTVEMPAWPQPGHPEGVVTLHLGGGRRATGRSEAGVGVDVNILRTVGGAWNAVAKQVEATGREVKIAVTQPVQVQNGRNIIRARPVGDLGATGEAKGGGGGSGGEVPRGKGKHLSLYGEYSYAGYRWGMAIDQSVCIGCNACVVACQAENNVPTVGKEQVFRGREMHWLRIDTYYGAQEAADIEVVSGEVNFMPMMCQHCETAPCEVVCPVEATSHSQEGINEMTYNRCVGTRYCSNNCPYKVRRFNFLHFSAIGQESDSQKMESLKKNPNVTVRSRGVMEKCNYCLQRISRGRIEAKKAWAKNATDPALNPAPAMREPAKGTGEEGTAGEQAIALPRVEVLTACQQACPTEAIIFGDLNDAASLAAKMRERDPWRAVGYELLEELNTQPRTEYLEKLTNPNPALVGKGGAA
jgi:molybdopterin-containing oxidoreductase family iron-sulfur binding subunit